MTWPPDWLKSIPADGYAWVLLGLALLAAWLLWRAARQIVWWGYFAFYAIIGYALQYFARPLYSDTPLPQQYMVIGALLFSGFCLAVRSRIMRVVGAIASLAIMAAIGSGVLNGHIPGTELVTNLISNQHGYGEQQLKSLKAGAFVKRVKPRAPKNQLLPKGWLSEQPYSTWGFPDYPKQLKSQSSQPLWHTWLTGLLHVQTTNYDIWCPGGTLKEAQDGLQLREHN